MRKYYACGGLVIGEFMKILRCTLTLSLIGLAACTSGTVKSTLGLDSASPDEYRVVSRPPLSVPPQFSLRPPSATAQSPNQVSAESQAQSLIVGASPAGAVDTAVVPVTEEKAGGSAEAAFLKQVGADKADPNVREKLVESRIAVQDQQQDSSWWDIFSSNPPSKETVVDANKESQRIKGNEDTGQPVTTGDTAVVKQQDTGVLGRIFGY